MKLFILNLMLTHNSENCDSQQIKDLANIQFRVTRNHILQFSLKSAVRSWICTNSMSTYVGVQSKEVTSHHSLIRAPLQDTPPPCR